MFSRVLVANRGEIAVRIVRACRDLGIESVVAFSEADRESLAVRLADDAVCVGPAARGRSYLNVAGLLYACARTGADAVHPGYGFLSEDADFAQVCADAGIAFIGPSPSVIAAMGDKIASRAAMGAVDVPLSPGSSDEVRDVAAAREVVDEIGLPVMVKASAGGGGRGLRVVRRREELGEALSEVRRTARVLFQDERAFIERYHPAARHVEVQVLGDRFGRVVHLHERDCTVQRRHQKLLEEAPAVGLTDVDREALCAAAVRGARAIGYVGAGTVEFLVDDSGRAAFLEMNTRVQVEHPVTEMITGVDVVAWSIRLAAGEPLDLVQADVPRRGHAIECRINAERADAAWAGSSGRITELTLPGGPGVRVDTHGYAGYFFPPHYDSLLAKIVVTAPDRPAALRRLRRALDEFDCRGIETTAGVHREILHHPVFVADRHDLGFIDQHLGVDGHLSTRVPARPQAVPDRIEDD